MTAAGRLPAPRMPLLARLRLTGRRAALPRPPAFVVVVATVTVLNIVGLVMILSASSVAALSNYGSSWYFFNRQAAWGMVGAVAFWVASRVDYRRWRRLTAPLVLAAGVALLVVLLPGVGIEVAGARRWLGFGTLRFQPSEVAKLALLLLSADVLTRRVETVGDYRRGARPVVAVFLAFAALVLVEPDLDSTIVLALIVLSVLVVGGVPLRQVATLVGAGAVASVALAILEPYRRRRITVFLHPFAHASDAGYQIAQSLIALGSGGWAGVGLGAGRAKWLFLPNAHTDFIFAIIGEELGLIGCLLVVGLFACFGLVGFRVALRAPDRFGTLLAVGVTTWIAGQAIINLGAVIGLLPVSGIPLPFLSAGGSALVFSMAAAGILANVARHSGPPARTRERAARPAG